MDTRVKQIGFLHFVRDFDSPIPELDKAIASRIKADGDIGGSLVVLPEAFNGGDYNPPVREIRPDETLEQLHLEFAAPLHIAFVVGILNGHDNSAYWVDSDGPCL